MSEGNLSCKPTGFSRGYLTKEQRQIITVDDLIVEFAANMSLGMKSIVAASETYVTAINKYGERARERFAQKFPTIRPVTWAVLEDIGRGKLPPQATMMSSGAVEKLRQAKLPRKKLELVAESRVSVYNPATGAYDVVPFQYLTEKQADLVLNPVTHSIRTVMQQKRYVAKREGTIESKPKNVRPRDYAVVDDGILFRKTTHLTFAQLRQILDDAERGNC